MSKKPFEFIPNLDEIYEKTCEFVRTHQGEKGYIDTQDQTCDGIYAMVYEDEMGHGIEVEVHGVRYNNETRNLEIVYEYISRTIRIVYGDEDFRSESTEWEPIRYSEIVYYVYTLMQIAESIHEYTTDKVEDGELRKKLFDLYKRAADYICGSEETTIDIINDAADILTESKDKLAEAPEITNLLGRCLIHCTKDFEEGKEPTFEQYVSDGYELVEELSGTLGEFFE